MVRSRLKISVALHNGKKVSTQLGHCSHGGSKLLAPPMYGTCLLVRMKGSRQQGEGTSASEGGRGNMQLGLDASSRASA